jgi:Protein kinase domain
VLSQTRISTSCGNSTARFRFLREARAAASVRHPNVASVFHLGRTGSSYFYAMEFVEGETLERLIKRSGRLDVKPALEIATRVAAGLAAIHEQNLVHSSEPTEDAAYSFARRTWQTASKSGTQEDFDSQIAHYRKRSFWSRGGYRFPGSCMGEQGGQRRYNRCLGRGRKIHAGQPLAKPDGCQTLSFR